MGYEWDMNGILTDTMDGYGGFHSHGGTPIAAWFIAWNIPSFEMDDDWGYPKILGNLQ